MLNNITLQKVVYEVMDNVLKSGALRGYLTKSSSNFYIADRLIDKTPSLKDFQSAELAPIIQDWWHKL